MPLDSPNPFAETQGPNLADLIEAVEAARDCTPLARREMCSALRSLAKWFDLPPSAMPANMQYIRHRLVRFHPLHGGISKRRLQNVRSLTSKAFRVAGLATRSRSYLCPLTPEWRAL